MCFFYSGQQVSGRKRTYLQLEEPMSHEVFLSKTNSVLTGNNVLDTADSNMDGFLREIYVFLQLS
jgi:hypothetical protein